MGLAAAVIGAGTLAAGATLATGAMSAGAARDAATTNANALNANNAADRAVAERIRGENGQLATNANTSNEALLKTGSDLNNEAIGQYTSRGEGLYQPGIAQGRTAGDAISALLGLSGDATQQDQAFRNWAGSSGMKFQLDQGSNAITANKATAGLLNSGSTLKALDKYGQGVGSTYFGNYLASLQGQQQMGQNATNSLSNVYGNAASLQASNNNAWTSGRVANNNNTLAISAGANSDAGNQIISGNTNTTNALIANNNNATQAQIAANNNISDSINGLVNTGVTAYGYSQGLKPPLGSSTGASSYNIARGGVGV